MPAVLFVCTANHCRSPIAEATFIQELRGNGEPPVWAVKSAGTWTKSGTRVDSISYRIAKTVGIDLRDHVTTSIEDAHLEDYDWIAVMEFGHLEALTIEYPQLNTKIHMLTSLAGYKPYEISDPLKNEFDIAVEIIKDMQECVRRFCRRLIADC